MDDQGKSLTDQNDDLLDHAMNQRVWWRRVWLVVRRLILGG